MGDSGLLGLTGSSHQGLSAAFMLLLSAVIFSRGCVLVILNLLFDFAGWTQTVVCCEQKASYLAGSAPL